jgi:hypothetical protein
MWRALSGYRVLKGDITTAEKLIFVEELLLKVRKK